MTIYDKYLKENSSAKNFKPPEQESLLRQRSAKLSCSTRLFPEWTFAIYAIFKDKYPEVPISSQSELIALIAQDYIMDNFGRIQGVLPGTEPSINFLLQKGFINPDSKSQLRNLSKAEYKAQQAEERVGRTSNLKEKYDYWKTRDPEKAEAYLERMAEQVAQTLGEEPQEQEPLEPLEQPPQPPETISTENRRDGIAGAIVPQGKEEKE